MGPEGEGLPRRHKDSVVPARHTPREVLERLHDGLIKHPDQLPGQQQTLGQDEAEQVITEAEGLIGTSQDSQQ